MNQKRETSPTEPSVGPEAATGSPDQAHTEESDNTDQESLTSTLIEQLTTLAGQTTQNVQEISELFRLELKLTIGDARRLLLTWLALLPVIILTWISSCVLIAWLVYDASASVTAALTTFTLLQLTLCIALLKMRKRFRSGLGFKRTRKHTERLLQGMTDEAQRPGETD